MSEEDKAKCNYPGAGVDLILGDLDNLDIILADELVSDLEVRMGPPNQSPGNAWCAVRPGIFKSIGACNKRHPHGAPQLLDNNICRISLLPELGQGTLLAIAVTAGVALLQLDVLCI